MSADLAQHPLLVNGSRTKAKVQPATSVPWYIWAGALAVTSASLGGQWDVAWHRSIGRDTFWTPAHMAIYACGVIAGIVGMYLVFATTFGKSVHAARLREASVNIFGLRAPLGVFLAGWGGVAMLTSAPFDNWWHNAYGLDVKIISPPHALLILGIRAIDFGMLFLILAAMNRASDAGDVNYPNLRRLFLYLGGLVLGGQMFFIMEYTWDVGLHRGIAYICLAIAVPVVLATISQASRFRWAATTIAAIYTISIMAFILIFPLFPAQPKLGPVFYPVTHLVPPKFPILLIVPAFALDLLWHCTKTWKFWQVALLSGLVFVGVIFAVEWPFASFLLSPASENRFFGTTYFDYNSRPDGFDRLRHFFRPDSGATLWFGLFRATLYASFSTWLGLLFGRWMRGVQR
ncbi:hypothetical protein [Occallatibacter savannae]|uniref:hypothetical protein n=1 Tax=Occallatibacter savannae TaxID=1002691 RepID=UPI001EF515E2|nr:hypothetical protein [Occallatibacter savannae]